VSPEKLARFSGVQEQCDGVREKAAGDFAQQPVDTLVAIVSGDDNLRYAILHQIERGEHLRQRRGKTRELERKRRDRFPRTLCHGRVVQHRAKPRQV
jgi:hypothetical protein